MQSALSTIHQFHAQFLRGAANNNFSLSSDEENNNYWSFRNYAAAWRQQSLRMLHTRFFSAQPGSPEFSFLHYNSQLQQLIQAIFNGAVQILAQELADAVKSAEVTGKVICAVYSIYILLRTRLIYRPQLSSVHAARRNLVKPLKIEVEKGDWGVFRRLLALFNQFYSPIKPSSLDPQAIFYYLYENCRIFHFIHSKPSKISNFLSEEKRIEGENALKSFPALQNTFSLNNIQAEHLSYSQIWAKIGQSQGNIQGNQQFLGKLRGVLDEYAEFRADQERSGANLIAQLQQKAKTPNVSTNINYNIINNPIISTNSMLHNAELRPIIADRGGAGNLLYATNPTTRILSNQQEKQRKLAEKSTENSENHQVMDGISLGADLFAGDYASNPLGIKDLRDLERNYFYWMNEENKNREFNWEQYKAKLATLQQQRLSSSSNNNNSEGNNATNVNNNNAGNVVQWDEVEYNDQGNSLHALLFANSAFKPQETNLSAPLAAPDSVQQASTATQPPVPAAKAAKKRQRLAQNKTSLASPTIPAIASASEAAAPAAAGAVEEKHKSRRKSLKPARRALTRGTVDKDLAALEAIQAELLVAQHNYDLSQATEGLFNYGEIGGIRVRGGGASDRVSAAELELLKQQIAQEARMLNNNNNPSNNNNF
jgi:hypothetical protein